uniref:ABC transporter domain-containing protein n=1 Tax=Neobodo designis TaxID=312471 RepID=A0A7S1MTE9_NEODS|mmetsp:Transcript_46201/g.142469  ORF Transcript_46201/g.142469 Transcript_46201/m.142469 type:complete len:729 (+) Transcript_46201:109-2295(+)
MDWGAELAWLGKVVTDKLRTERPTAAALGLSLATVMLASATAEKGIVGGEKTKQEKAAEKAAPTSSPTTATDASPTGPAMSKKEADRRAAAKVRVRVDKAFVKNFFKLLRIAFPKMRSQQGLHLVALSLLLLVRTALSLKIAQMAGMLAKRMVEAKPWPFYSAVIVLALWSVPASLCNSGIKYVTALLQVAFRRNLTQHFHGRYLTQEAFFRCVGLGSVDHVDQRMTEDIQRWSDDAASLYSSIFKPIVDIVLFSHQVAKFGGYKAPGLIIAWYGLVTVLMRLLAPPFAAMTNQQQRMEGDFRGGHTHLLSYAEEVVMSQGEVNQRSTLNRLFHAALRQANAISFTRARHAIFDGLLVKYGSVMVGYAVCAISNFSAEASKLNSGELTGLYLHTSRLLTDLAKAIGALILTYKTVAGIAGYTHRICELDKSIAAIEKAASRARRQASSSSPTTAPDSAAASPSSAFASSQNGTVVVGDTVEFEQVPIVSPDSTVLIEALSFFVRPGMNLLIVGPNGCGKSSTFRLLGELWPLQGGRITKPSYEHLYYVPQRPYMSSGSLRDQIVYPDRFSELTNVSESRLYDCLAAAGLEDILDRPGISWDAKLNWSGDALSHGEKQKLAMARLFFHKPRFAILDECSSAVDVDVEQKLYQACFDRGITLLTIAHRRSVWQYHNWTLAFDGNGGYMFSPLKFTDAGDLHLTKVVFASDEAMIGKAVVRTNAGAQVLVQ